jgi:hypothetical protein
MMILDFTHSSLEIVIVFHSIQILLVVVHYSSAALHGLEIPIVIILTFTMKIMTVAMIALG